MTVFDGHTYTTQLGDYTFKGTSLRGQWKQIHLETDTPPSNAACTKLKRLAEAQSGVLSANVASAPKAVLIRVGQDADVEPIILAVVSGMKDKRLFPGNTPAVWQAAKPLVSTKGGQALR